jgi:tRNA threonylcarbamoyladenosine biosynthesis protein TsaE
MATLTLPRRSANPTFSRDLGSAEETQNFGRRLAKRLRKGDVVALVGKLGSGKTTLVQGIAQGWGYRGGAISPSFALANEYHAHRGELFHIDLYRLTPREVEDFPLEEYFSARGVCLIEWAERVRSRWPHDTLEIDLKILSPQRRCLSLRAPSPLWIRRLQPVFLHED